MQQVKTTNQVVETRDRRIAKSIVVAYSCEITKIEGEKETYKVQSETDVSRYYIVKFIDGTPVFCQCPDFIHRIKSNPFHVCKHVRAAENYGLVTTKKSESKSFKEEEYSF